MQWLVARAGRLSARDGISLTDDEESKVFELCYADSLIAIADYENDRGDYLYEQARDRRAMGDDA